ncbi:bifunctional GNAT family N-acetyltransferase/carbon-nitrogen hydrolase family protein [Aneurinibacillus sp. Ricciae_BoGa-3]|uniref:bifunctional GNAT family N-acetyltransferase/carbon-nitrogen hydrolase family protein n=1 Tax=Aneurinibacillus sp. Ricciae_BoGa-3 TaxID=3022697 RepID=UPI0023428899|nr:bifunctional GNAT family N-acetyltransferase/carbon-nitrogen hydrolase family protein [Aneurinibacillus sp. Ricciae_BoGa-3]WCK56378.1 bifunctional GNAT family N-acetyltransferase/carbon-nitrogen hydrolase family protein [Aneurinibacillus sp. Ricciae_BoGa-3]
MSETDMSKYEKKIVVRNTRMEDVEELVALCTRCFPNMEPWKREQLQSHIRIFPQGQFCVEYEDKIVGSCSSLIVNFDEYDDQHTWDVITDNGYITNHDPTGLNLYGIEVMVDPEYRRMKIGHRLYEARRELARELNLQSIIIGGRIPNYHNYKGQMTPREYVAEVEKHNIYDPVLSFQLLEGFSIKRINTRYLPDDQASEAFATLMEWNNIDYLPKSRRVYRASFPVRICAVQYMMKKIDSLMDFTRQVEYYVDVAADFGSDFALFPELFTTQLLSFLEEKRPDQAVRRLANYTDQYIELFTELAVRYNINIVGGSHFVAEDGDVYNVAYLFRRDGTIEKQPKIHVTPNEHKWWGITEGNKLHVFDTDCGRIAIQISYDIEFPELARMAADKGANIIFVPFSTDDRQGYLRVRYCAQARAIENQVYTCIAGTVGNLTHVENMDIQYAQSAIFSPSDFGFARDGIVGECDANVDTVVVGDVDLEKLRRSRNSGSVRQLRDRRRDLYRIELKNLKMD